MDLFISLTIGRLFMNSTHDHDITFSISIKLSVDQTLFPLFSFHHKLILRRHCYALIYKLFFRFVSCAAKTSST